MISEVPLGNVSKHIKQSTGGSSDILNNYCTTSETTFGSSWKHFTPRIGAHSGSGYVPNNRMVLGYTSHLDEIDNPRMGQLIKTNYKSITHKHYNPYLTLNGREALPESALYQPTGFIRDKGTHIPTQTELHSVYINGLLDRSPANVNPKKKPVLHKINPKDPVIDENYGHGPKYMSTEYKTRYQGEQRPELGKGRIGNREETGFTENIKTEEPTEGRPDACACGDKKLCGRNTGVSIYYTDYWPLQVPNGREPLPAIGIHSADTGFSTGNKAIPDYVQIHPERVYDKACDMTPAQLEWIKKNDPAEYMNAIYNGNKPTITKGTYQGHQIDPLGSVNCLNVGIGNKEITGQTKNEDGFIQTRDNPARFITHNMTKFYDPTVIGRERDGHVNMHIQPLKEDGYFRSAKIHQIESQPDALHVLNRFLPFQSRSVAVREAVTIAPTKVPA